MLLSNMTKKALLIGANYSGANQLYGCINDIIQMKGLLIDVYGFQPSEIVTLRDDDSSNMPTKTRILKELGNLSADFVFIQYSGHGTSIADTTKDEKDGKDECIVPSDCKTSGIISDDELKKALVGLKGTGIAVFDCCHSGTILDLPFETINAANTATTSGGIYCFSGCLDSQLASETFADVPGLPQGAMTDAFISALRTLKYYPTIGALYTELKNVLQSNGFSQIPYITSSVEVTPTTAFPYPDQVKLPITVPNVALTAQINTLTAQKTQLTVQINTLTAQKTQLTVQINTLTVQLTAQNVALTSQINTLTAQKTQLTVQINTLTAQLTAQKTQLTAQINTLTAQINTLTAQLKTQNVGLTRQNVTLTSQNVALSRQNVALTAQLNTLKTQLQKK
jgi:flagellar capping protein FliD